MNDKRINKILHYNPPSETVQVTRILAQIHKAIDENFPHAKAMESREFARTVFSEDEQTALQRSADEMSEDELSSPEEQSSLEAQNPIREATKQNQRPNSRILGFFIVILLAGLSLLAYYFLTA